MDKIALFIDGANLYETAKKLGFMIDYSRLKSPFVLQGKIVRSYFYTAIHSDPISGNAKLQPIIDWLEYNGYTLVTKPARTYSDIKGPDRIKGNMDVELTVDALTLARSGKIEHIILMTGDGDFVYLVKAIQQEGVKVTVVSSKATDPPMVADILRRQADVFVELNDLKEKIQKC